jgi:hypothetical protein
MLYEHGYNNDTINEFARILSERDLPKFQHAKITYRFLNCMLIHKAINHFRFRNVIGYAIPKYKSYKLIYAVPLNLELIRTLLQRAGIERQPGPNFSPPISTLTPD